MDRFEIEKRLAELRTEYKNNPDKRKIILMQARALQIAKELHEKNAKNF